MLVEIDILRKTIMIFDLKSGIFKRAVISSEILVD